MSILVVPASAAAQLLGALVGKIAQLGGQAISEGILASIQERLMQRDVSKAIDKAFDKAIKRFEKNVHNKELLRAIAAQKGFWTNPALYDTLADVVIHTERRGDQMEALTQTFAAAAPNLPRHMSEQAASTLISALAVEVLNVTAFQSRLAELRTHLEKDAQPGGATPADSPAAHSLPPLDRDLRKQLLDKASELARELGHNFIGTAHLLYALAALDSNVASAILQDVGLSAMRLKPAIAQRLKADPARDARSIRHVPETEGVKHAFISARETAAREQEEVAGDEDVLQALLDMVDRGEDDGQSVAKVLKDLNVTTKSIRPPLAESRYVLRTFSSVHS